MEKLLNRWQNLSSSYLARAETYHYQSLDPDISETEVFHFTGCENHMMGCHRQWEAAIKDLKECMDKYEPLG